MPGGRRAFTWWDAPQRNRLLGLLLASAGLEQVVVRPQAFSYRIASAATLWEGAMGSLARTSALVRGQAIEVQRRIRSTFDRLVAAYSTADGVNLPMAFKIVSGRKK